MGIGNAKVAKRYAKALFSIVEPENFDVVNSALQVFATAWKDSIDLKAAFQNPSIKSTNKEELLSIFFGLVGNTPQQLKSFLTELLSQARLAALPEIATTFSELVDSFRKNLSLEVTTASSVTDAEKNDFTTLLKSKLGNQVTLQWSENSSIVGGVVIKCGDKLLDRSVSGVLEQMRTALLQ
jgi:F-type H+-transporting ATPase subunit delta